MDLVGLAAIVFTTTAIGAAAFQLSLALGASWGEYAMGGRFPGRFPAGMRVAALIQALILLLLAAIVLSGAGLAFVQWSSVASRLVWGVIGFAGISFVLNAITPSARERRIWLPVAGLMLISSTIVGLH